MKTLGRNLLAVVAGLIIGSIVNMALVNMGPRVIPLPEGADISSTESMRESMNLFTPANFLFPFLGHALGTLAGAYVAARIGAGRPLVPALIVGVFFLAGGVTAASMFGGPAWFITADLVLAYLPMAFLGMQLASRGRSGA
jgi:hypothetical protein